MKIQGTFSTLNHENTWHFFLLKSWKYRSPFPQWVMKKQGNFSSLNHENTGHFLLLKSWKYRSPFPQYVMKIQGTFSSLNHENTGHFLLLKSWKYRTTLFPQKIIKITSINVTIKKIYFWIFKNWYFER